MLAAAQNCFLFLIYFSIFWNIYFLNKGKRGVDLIPESQTTFIRKIFLKPFAGKYIVLAAGISVILPETEKRVWKNRYSNQKPTY